MNFNELFVDKSKTLIINTDLALVLGDLNEAIVLNQLNYWLGINRKAGKNFIDDRYWVYNSYSDWKAKDFPYWSEKTIQRTFTRLDRMVNEHFGRTHRRETNYSITHFAKSDYLLQLAQGIIEY